jgi:hypothetical protein
VVPREHREYLYTHKIPPDNGVWVRLATYEASDLVHYAYQGLKVERTDHPEPTKPTIYFVTITAVALVVQLAGSLIPEWSFDFVPYLSDLGVVRIWPAVAMVDFPQRTVHTHESLIGLTKVLYNVVGGLEGGAPPAR